MADEGRQVHKKRYLAELLAKLGKGLRRQGEPQGTGPANRHGAPVLPVGQHKVVKWPRLDLGMIPDLTRETWRLDVGGLCEQPQTLDWAALQALPQVEDVSDFHCVTTWSRMDNRWKGVRFRDLAEHCGVSAEARFVFCEGYDQTPDGTPYTTNLSLESALVEDVLLVYEWEGEPLPAEHGGPVRMITPRLYAWKGTKWIKGIKFLAEDEPGFWEVRGYSMTADPWADDRYRPNSSQ
jgi:DMSO/TMAO reductase YedYZ molybdopterin-dependent catalytic subunit